MFYKQLRESEFFFERSISMLFKGDCCSISKSHSDFRISLWMCVVIRDAVDEPSQSHLPTIREQPSSAILRLYHMTTKKSHAGLGTSCKTGASAEFFVIS